MVGDSLLHSILNASWRINFDNHYNPSKVVAALSLSTQVIIATREKSIGRSLAPEMNSSRKTEASFIECRKLGYKKVEFCEFARFVQERKSLAATHHKNVFWIERSFIPLCELIGLGTNKHNSRISLIFIPRKFYSYLLRLLLHLINVEFFSSYESRKDTMRRRK